VLVLSAIGLLDDRWGIPPLPRLVVHLGVAAGVAFPLGGLSRLPLPPPLDLPLGAAGGVFAMVWIVAVVNFYNFLDGIDGLAALQAVATGTGLAFAAWDSFSAALGAGLAAASLGFLVFNWSPARIFLGDVGSGVLGFVFASAPLLAPADVRPGAVFFVGLSLFLFLADALLTLLMRAGRGAHLYEAHREHLYQRLVAAGWTHAQVSSMLGLGAAILTTAAYLAWRRPEVAAWSWAALALAMMAFGGELGLVRRTAGDGVREGAA
jgi:Fuc2NAc and GlcNAc transferase